MAEREDRLGLCGERLGDYKIRSVLGSGGFGVVYQAVNVPLQRPVALKVLSPHKSNVTETLFKRFLREARLLARISHPNIAAIYRVGQEDRYFFIEMELVEGRAWPVSCRSGAAGWRPTPLWGSVCRWPTPWRWRTSRRGLSTVT
jgi:serine/threonine-protein kinase